MAKGKLFLIPTIISEDTQNEVIPPHVKSAIQELDYFLVENLRSSRRYISSLGLNKTIEDLRFEVLDKNTTGRQLQELMQGLFDGVCIGVISEAGCPGIADPGALAVEFAHRHDIQVVPLVGPSSILMALMSSGFNGQSFAFHGYLPFDKTSRLQKIKSMEADAYRNMQTQIFMDTPYRNKSLADDLLSTCRPDSRLCIARDITGKKEMVKTKTIRQWKSDNLPDLHKIPAIFALYC